MLCRDILRFFAALIVVLLTQVGAFAVGATRPDEHDFTQAVVLASMFTVLTAVRGRRDP
jgi:hypothetical protein